MPLLRLLLLLTLATSVAHGATLLSRTDITGQRVVATTGIAVDNEGFFYQVGTTGWREFPTTPGPFDTFRGTRGFSNLTGDVFVRKLTPDLRTVVYSVLIGGSADETSTGMAIDREGNVYVTGYTDSVDFPTTAGFAPARLPEQYRPDAFIFKLNAAGNALMFSRLLGGSEVDQSEALALAPDGKIILVGSTSSLDFPVTANALQTLNIAGAWSAYDMGQTAFIVRLARDGQIEYATYLGGTGGSKATGVDVDPAGNIYVGGLAGQFFPTQAGSLAAQALFGGFASKIDGQTGQLVYSTYLPSVAHSVAQAWPVIRVRVNSQGQAYLTGPALAGFPTTPGAFQTDINSNPYARYPGPDAFLLALDANGSKPIFSTLIGGGGQDLPQALVLGDNRVVIAGMTGSFDFPVNAFGLPVCNMVSLPPYDAGFPVTIFISTFDLSGKLLESFHYGSCADEQVSALALRGGMLYLSGHYYSAQSTFVATMDLATRTPVQIAAVTDAASYQTGPYVPLEIISIFGTGLGPEQGVAGPVGDSFPFELGGTRVSVDGRYAPLLFVRHDQVNAVVPARVSRRASLLQVFSAAGVSSPVVSWTEQVTPALFTADASGSGQAAILNQDGTPNSAARPATRGSIVSLWGTGGGLTQPLFADGQLVPGPAQMELAQYLGVTFGGKIGTVLYAGTAPTLVNGVLQINVRIPDNAPVGPAVPIVVGLYPFRSQSGVTIAIE